MDADLLPACECDHDFWCGINFHFDDCPKHQPVADMDAFFRGWHMALGGLGVRVLRVG